MAQRTSTPRAAITTRGTTLDPDDRFEVNPQPELKSSLTIMGAYRGATLTLSSHVEVVPGDNDWSFALDTARLEVRVDPTGHSTLPHRDATYVAERGSVSVRVTFEPSEPGHYGPLVVPAGQGRLDAPTKDYRAPAPVWAELDLAPGELRVLDLR